MHREDFVFSACLGDCLVVDDTSDRTSNFQKAAELLKKSTLLQHGAQHGTVIYSASSQSKLSCLELWAVFSAPQFLQGQFGVPSLSSLPQHGLRTSKLCNFRAPWLLQVCSHALLDFGCLNRSSSISYIFMLCFVKVLEHIDSPDLQSKAGIAS